jgi:glutathione S-transferase
MDEFTKQTDAIKTKLTELENKDELPEWFKTAFPYAKAPVLVSHELSVCEIVDTAQLILNNDDEKTPGLLQQYNGIMKQLQELKKEAEAEKVKSTVKGWFSNMWQKARNWFGNVKSEVEKKVAALEELKDKIGKTIDAAHQAIRDRLDSSESEKPAPGAKALRRLKEVRRLSVGPKGEHIILI